MQLRYLCHHQPEGILKIFKTLYTVISKMLQKEIIQNQKDGQQIKDTSERHTQNQIDGQQIIDASERHIQNTNRWTANQRCIRKTYLYKIRQTDSKSKMHQKDIQNQTDGQQTGLKECIDNPKQCK